MLSLEGREQGNLLLVPARVSMHPAEAAKRGLMPRPSRALLMMLDTGAKSSVLSEAVIAQLGCSQIGMVPVRTSLQAAVLRPQYFVSISIEMEDLSGTKFPVEHSTTVISQPMAAAAGSHQGIIGVDVLRRAFRLMYDGPGRTFTLTCDPP